MQRGFVFQMLMAGRPCRETGLLRRSSGRSGTGTCSAQHNDQNLSILWPLVCRVPDGKTGESGWESGVGERGHPFTQRSEQQSLPRAVGASAPFDKVVAQHSRTGGQVVRPWVRFLL